MELQYSSIKNCFKSFAAKFAQRIFGGTVDLRGRPLTCEELARLDTHWVTLQGELRSVWSNWNEEYTPIAPFTVEHAPLVDVRRLECSTPSGECFSVRVESEYDLPRGRVSLCGELGRTVRGRLILLNAAVVE